MPNTDSKRLATAGWPLGYLLAVVVGLSLRPSADMPALVFWTAGAVALMWLATYRLQGRSLRGPLVLLAALTLVSCLVAGDGLAWALSFSLGVCAAAWVGSRIWQPGERSVADLIRLLAATAAGSVVCTLALIPVESAQGGGWRELAEWLLLRTADTFAPVAMLVVVRGCTEPPGLRSRRMAYIAAAVAVVPAAVLVMHLMGGASGLVTLLAASVALGLAFDSRVLVPHLAVSWLLVPATAAVPGITDWSMNRSSSMLLSLFTGLQVLLCLTLALQREQNRQMVREAVALGEERAALAEQFESVATIASEQAALLDAVILHTEDGVEVLNSDGEAVLRNPAALAIADGLDERTSTWAAFTLQTLDGAPIEPEMMPHRRALDGSSEHTEVVVVDAVGRKRVLSVGADPLPESPGTAWSMGAVTTFRDVTERFETQARLQRSERMFRAGFEDAPIGMALISLDADPGTVLRVNAAFLAIGGHQEQDVVGSPAWSLLDEDQVALAEEASLSAVSGETSGFTVQVSLTPPDGRVRHLEITASILGEPGQGKDRQMLCMAVDVTDRVEAEQELTQQALHDPLTALPNRLLFEDRLTHALAAAGRSRVAVGVLYLDLDGFKQVNDGAGHGTGDGVLQVVADRLRECVRPGDTVARLGGDEFAIICPEVGSLVNLRRVANRVLSEVNRGIELPAGDFVVSASIGLRLAEGDDDPQQVIRDADVAMYAAKRAGKNQVMEHGEAQPTVSARSAQLSPQLREALEQGQLVAHGQPVVELATGAVVAAEALIRWQHPEHGLLLPGEFLDVVENGPLLNPVGRHVLDRAAAMAARWYAQFGDRSPAVHVNIAARQLESGELADDVRKALQDNGLPANKLVLELTETQLPRIGDDVAALLGQLRTDGVRIAIDDLGTGFASLNRLTEVPVDMVKIDVSFVAGLGQDDSCDAIVASLIDLGNRLNLDVVAEGVETHEQRKLLLDFGARFGQGYLFSRPLPQSDLWHRMVIPSIGARTDRQKLASVTRLR